MKKSKKPVGRIEFVKAPPPRGLPGRGEAPWRAELRKRPGQWARVQRLPNVRSASGYKIKGRYEAAGRVINGVAWLYARYIGKPTP